MAASVSSGQTLTVHYQTPEMKQRIQTQVDQIKLTRQKEALEAKSAACSQRIAARDQKIATLDQEIAGHDQRIAAAQAQVASAMATKLAELKKIAGFFTSQKENLGRKIDSSNPIFIEINQTLGVLQGLIDKQSQGIDTIAEVKKIQPAVDALGKRILALQKASSAGAAPIKQ